MNRNSDLSFALASFWYHHFHIRFWTFPGANLSMVTNNRAGRPIFLGLATRMFTYNFHLTEQPMLSVLWTEMELPAAISSIASDSSDVDA